MKLKNVKKPTNQDMAAIQAEFAVEKEFSGMSRYKAKRYAKRFGEMMRIIWKKHHVGVYQVKYTQVRDYFENNSHNRANDAWRSHFDIVCMCLARLNKSHWISLLKHDLGLTRE